MVAVGLVMPSVQSMPENASIVKEREQKICEAASSSLLETTTIASCISYLNEYIENMPFSAHFKHYLSTSVEQGCQELKLFGISPDATVNECEDIVGQKDLKDRLKTRRIIFNIYQDTVEIETVLPIFVKEQTENSSIEVFVKLVPIFDSVKTEQRLIIPKLVQETSFLWPAIGFRLVEDNETILIFAVGAGIRWSLRLL